MKYKVRLDSFEGPFDLLVYLIENAKMSIYDIKISQITSQYLEYLDEMRDMKIDIATEFIVLAASLLEIKTKLILPRQEKLDQGEIEEDPGSQLFAKLVEYKRFKNASGMLQDRFEETEAFWEKPQEDLSEYTKEANEILRLSEDEFIRAFEEFLLRKQRIEEVRRNYTKIERERITLENQISFMISEARSRFNGGEEEINFRELIPRERDREDVVVTFVSLLQTMRDKVFDAQQKSLYGDIYIREGEGISEVENG